MWPPDESTVIGGLAASLGGLVLSLWRRHEKRIDALESSMGTVTHREDSEAQAERLEQTIAGLRADVKEGFSESRTGYKELHGEIQRQTERLAERQSTLIREAHVKIESTARELRDEINQVRVERRSMSRD